jgi:hypothetical protein
MLLEVENLTEEPVQISYHLKSDFVPDDPWPGFEQDVNKKLGPGEKAEIHFSWSKLVGRDSITKEDYYKASVYTTLFERFSIEYLASKKQINIEEMENFSVRYRKKGTAHIYTIQILNL